MGSTTGLYGHISVMATLKFMYCLTKGIIFIKTTCRVSLIGIMFIMYDH